jgi:hypothetical protein
MARGVLYDGGIWGAGEVVEDIEQMLSRYVLNSCRWEFKNTFMGSIHASFVPNDDMLAKP